MTRLLRALTAALALVLVVAPLSLTASADEICPGVFNDGTWTTVASPQYPAGPRTITEFAVHPYAPNVLVATNGTSLMVTLDLGCSWEPRLVLDTLPSLDVPFSGVNSEIVDIEIPESKYAHDQIYLLVEEKAGALIRPHVVVSRDGGQTWRASDEGLPPATGNAHGIHVAPNSPNFVYVQTSLPTGADELYASTNGGRTWERRSKLPPQGGAFDLAVDPQNSNELWFWGGGGLYHSTDGGNSRQNIEYVPPNIPLADVWHGTTASSRILAWEPETFTFSLSLDGGRTWTRISGPKTGHGLAIAHGRAPYDVVFSMHEGLFQLTREGWRDITPPSHVDLLDIEITKTAPTLVGRTTTTLELLPNLTGGVTLSPFEIHAVDIETHGVPEMNPRKVELKLAPGQKKTVQMNLDLPPLPNPLDVFFLVDTSSSMDSTIAGLRVGMQDIIEDLAGAGLDVQFGVGEFKDYPIPGYGDAQAGDFPYRLNRVIGPVDAQLKAALERLESSGGGALDQPESQLTGLYQAATGAGDPPWVPADQDAGFRREAMKVIVNITDARFHNETQHPSPPFATVAQALKDKGILQVGLAIYGPNGANGEDDLREMARQTNTFAQVPVDCDENGSPDIAPGQALVCEISDEDYDGSLNLAPAIVATLKAVTHEVGVELVPRESDELVQSITPGFLESVNLKEPNRISFDVTFRCPPSLFGTKNNKVPLQALVGNNVEARSLATVTCKPDPVAQEQRELDEVLPLLVPPVARVVVALAALPPPPPPPIEQIPGTQQMAQAQGAFATEEQQQLQVAVARQRSRFQSAKEEVYEFTAYKDNRPSPAPLYLAAMVMGAAYAAVHGLRRKPRVALARRRSR
ncbi:MAG: hypothetical protein KY391_02980 [Actinobacteria bacterium]|nr:hypothetical protein [Actinomycetota bacterium]